MIQATVQAIALYNQSPEVHSAVRVIANIAHIYADARESGLYTANEQLVHNLVQFLYEYDHLRANEVESLKAQLIDALQWSVKPLRLPKEE